MKNKNAFSLMEMMVVLLITAVIAAATAPMVSKKIVSSTNDSPWVWAGMNSNSIVFNPNGENKTINIGGILPNPSSNKASLYINSKDPTVQPQILLGSSGNVIMGIAGISNGAMSIGNNPQANGKYSIAMGDDHTLSKGENSVAIGMNTSAEDKYAVAIGNDSTARNEYTVAMGKGAFAKNAHSVAIGEATAESTSSIAIGNNASAKGDNSISIGNSNAVYGGITIGKGAETKYSGKTGGSLALGETAHAYGRDSTAVGYKTRAEGNYSVALGEQAIATAYGSTAIGHGAHSNKQDSVAIGPGSETTANDQIVLGSASTTVYIPGNLVVDKDVSLAAKHNYSNFKIWNKTVEYKIVAVIGPVTAHDVLILDTSDRRLKNVGDAFKGGLAEIKKLEVFNYTFKKDPNKTPMVGVIAQDLQKIFPNAVFKGEDGFLRIRIEDMFYSVINAVKELDNKISLLEQKQKKIDELEKKISKLEARLDKLEKAKK